MKNLKRGTLALSVLIALLSVFFLVPDRRDGSEQIKTKIFASFDNGDSGVYTVRHPSYAGIGIRQSRGGHRLSTWEYCMFKGWVRCEKTLIYGVQRFEYR